jgi:mannose-6-phosphate isomerase
LLFFFALFSTAKRINGMEQDKYKVFRLQGKIQHYAWGGNSFLPALLSLPNPEGRPFAEYWMGAHDNASSEIIPYPSAAAPELSTGTSPGVTTLKLNEYIKTFPTELLGAYTAGRFGRLPYLLKILDVKDMLSIQVHPSKANAEKGFLEENKQGIPVNAPDRNYKDDNHKPELMAALSEFWLLHGFKPAPLMKQILQDTPELRFLGLIFDKDGYQGLYKTVMELPQLDVNEVLQPLLDRILPAYQEGRLDKAHEDFWAARAALTFNETGRIDRGIFSIYLFNLLLLHPGQAVFQDAGLPHAYLEGQNVEIMANSDNVLRGGLTPKHIDVPELLRHIRFEATDPQIIPGKSEEGSIAVFPTPAPDFELGRIALLKGEAITITARSVEIFIVLEGRVSVEENAQNGFGRKRGEAFLAFDGGRLKLSASEDAVVYRAAVPVGD